MSLFFATAPGLEQQLEAEARELGFASCAAVPGGVAARGGWPEVWKANLMLRTAGRVMVRVAEFRAAHLAQLDKRLRRIDWTSIVRPGTAWRTEAVCRRSRIYHDRAARQRLDDALRDALGTPPDPERGMRLALRIEDDLVTVSLDSSGAPLHRRGYKEAVGKAPLRETLAAGFLRAAGYDGRCPVLDPMCGSGTFVLEAAAIAAGQPAGAARRFAFEDLASFDPDAFAQMRRKAPPPPEGPPRFLGFDRDDGAIRGAAGNADRAGLSALCRFERQPISALVRPPGPAGLVMVNPPYGARIGDRKLLFALYGSLGSVLLTQLGGWRVGLVTSDGGLAKASGLPFLPAGPPVAHGGLKVRLWQTGPLPGG